jgi:hypothetical protein
MKLKSTFLILILASIFSACEDGVGPAADKRDFVRGDVIIGIKTDVSINAVFDLMNERDVTIDQMSGFFYYSTLSNDSLDYVIHTLQNKAYCNRGGFKGGSAYVHALDNRIVVTQIFFDMDLDAQQDWVSTIDKLKLHDLGNDTRNLVIEVNPGTEKFWMKKFKEHPYVKWAELNYIGGFEPLN